MLHWHSQNIIPKDCWDFHYFIQPHSRIRKKKNNPGKTSEEGIIAMLEGMKLRPDRSEVIKKSKIPFMLILGKKDSHIQFESVKSKIELNQRGELCVLEHSGHMGFIEEPRNSAEMIKSFVRKC